jgi:hypothetical protein
MPSAPANDSACDGPLNVVGPVEIVALLNASTYRNVPA